MSSESVDLKSVDAMFATLIAESRANNTAVMLRMSSQDLELAKIREQTTITNGRVTKIEQRERDRNVRIAAMVAAYSSLGGIISFLVHRAFFT